MQTSFQNQVKAGISAIGNPQSQTQYGQAFGPGKSNMYANMQVSQ